MVSDFWHGKRVFLTGHTGFKGAWLALWLKHLGAEIHGYAQAPATDPNLYQVAGIGGLLAGETISDICDRTSLQTALAKADPDIVLHLAAQAIVLQAYRDPVEAFATNVVGTVTLLDCVRQLPRVRAVLVVTSDKCYENREWLWGYRETDRLGGRDPYSASKGACELAVASMRQSYFDPQHYAQHGVAIATARAGNVIGGGDWSEHRLVPDLMRALAAGQPCDIRNPQAIRPWQHVLEPLAGYLALAEALWRDGPLFGEGWNFGPRLDNARSVAWIADYLSQSAWRHDRSDSPHENTYLKLDISKALAHLPWSPIWTLERSLDSILNWFDCWRKGEAMQSVMLREIEQYCRDAGWQEP
jgi:CDP-glucose 4,6-dehydratase